MKADYDEVRQFANSSDLGANLNEITVDPIWTKLKRNIIEIRNKFVPLKKPESSKCRWATRKVKSLREAKKEAWLKYVKSGKDIKLYASYKEKLRESVKENNKAKIIFEKNLADNIKRNSKSFYAYVRSKQRNTVKVSPLKIKSSVFDFAF